jgi:hypothetical protein
MTIAPIVACKQMFQQVSIQGFDKIKNYFESQ